MIQELIDNGSQLSGINLEYYKILKKSVKTYSVNWEVISGFSSYPIPTFISVCPECLDENKWHTTGLLPGSITCKKCNEKFVVII